MKHSLITVTASATVFAWTTSVPAHAAQTPPKHKPAPANMVKGQGQLAGVNGRFSTVYSLDSGFNFSVVSAAYTVSSATTPSQACPGPKEKLLVINFALKNATPKDQWFSTAELFTVVDQTGQLYTMGSEDCVLASQGKATHLTLRPGQGVGQAGTPDTLQAVIGVPNGARIVKIMLNRKRLNSSDATIRYYVAGATKAEAGEDGDPKNTIAALPADVRDPSDPSGAVALAEGNATFGTAVPSRFMNFSVDSVAFAPDGTTFHGKGPDAGKKFVIATITISAPAGANGPKLPGHYSWPGGGADSDTNKIVDSDGEKYSLLGNRKAKRDEALDDDSNIDAGGSLTYRLFYTVPKDVTLKKLTLGVTGGRQWAYDLTSVK